MFYSETISTMVYALAYEKNGRSVISNRKILKIEGFIFRQVNRMPDFILFSFKILFILFILFSLFTKKNMFSKLSLSDRLYIINKWRFSSFKPMRDFIRVFDSLVIFSLMDVLDEA